MSESRHLWCLSLHCLQLLLYLLGVTDINPLDYRLVFERFLNVERKEMPDIDMDFQDDRRSEVLDYVVAKYGHEHVAQIITFGTLGAKASVRDVGRALAIPYSDVDRIARMIPSRLKMTLNEALLESEELRDAVDSDSDIAELIKIAQDLEGSIRHSSTHAAGVVISQKPIGTILPLQRATKNVESGIPTTQYAMDSVAALGLLKLDFLGLSNLSVMANVRDLVLKTKGVELNLREMPPKIQNDKTFEMLSEGKTAGVFQLEGSGMTRYITELKPDSLGDIAAMIALFRPGPMDHIPSFCNRKHGKENIEYLHPLLEKVLKETYGIIVYQEQVMQIAQVLSNYTLGEADLLRRAMGKKIQKEMDAQKNRFIEGAKSNKISINEASKIFDLVNKFAGYGFNKSHAAGYALLAYQTAYLKTNFPYEFMTATFNYSIDRTDRIILLNKELSSLNIEFKKPDINHSQAKFSIEENNGLKSIRFGLSAIKGVGIKSMSNLVKERENNGKFIDIIDFMNRLKGDVINKRQLEKLVQAGSFDSIETNRAKLFYNVPKFVEIYGGSNFKDQNQAMLFEENKLSFDDSNLFDQQIDDWSSVFLLKSELEVIGFYFSSHPVSLYPKNYFRHNNIIEWNQIKLNEDIKSAKIVGSILDIKER